MTTSLKLYSTSSCHLCEIAATMLADLASYDFSWQEVEIFDSELLMNQFGTRIPVLLNCDSGQELNWPFTSSNIIQLISRV